MNDISNLKDRIIDIKFCLMFFLVTNNYWTALCMPASLPGQKFYAGLSYGFAEGLSSCFAGVLCTFVSDKNSMLASTVFIMTCLTFFYFVCDGSFSGTFALVLFFCSVFGCGF